MKLKKLVALILALVTALSLVACGSGGNGSGGGDSTDGDTSNFPKMTWSAATSGAEGSNFDVGLEKFSELLQEKTGGAIKLDIYCSDQLTNGNQADSIQANIDGTMGRIDAMMDKVVEAFDKQLDALFADEALDISTDITVLEQMLAQEGLGGMQMGQS